MKTYHQLTHHERYLIGVMRTQRLTVVQMADRLGRHRSTIYREVERNKSTYDGHYGVNKAHSYAVARLRRCRRGPQYSQQELRQVDEMLRRWWSPQQISGVRAKRRGWQISAQTIYRHIERDKRRGGDLWRQMRILPKFGRKRYGRQDSRGVLPGKRHISERPAAVERRRQIGHWEGDTVMGSDMRHCVLTLVERVTGYVIIKKLTARNKEQACQAAIEAIRERRRLFKTITFDNGTEFHDYKVLEATTGVKCYFATPYHSWERGTNENTNGLIRQYLPKGKCMAHITQDNCSYIQGCLNNRPRKRLGYRPPAELIRRA
ncbi:MAG: IS30 family transposase [Prosthecobacter sp.]|nr:IS30 family transposase [Prosthecobacter sp.]